MTTYKKYLIESEILIEDIEKNCKPYLKELRTGVSSFIRYSRTWNNTTIIRKEAKKDREPRDTPKEVHKLMDDTLKSKFGWKPRSDGLFVWIAPKNFEISLDVTSRKGGYVFPIGPYKYVYNPEIFDVYAEYESIESDLWGQYKEPKLSEKAFEDFKGWWLNNKDALKGYKDINALSVRSRCECMLKLKSYYIIPTTLIGEINNKLYFGIR